LGYVEQNITLSRYAEASTITAASLVSWFVLLDVFVTPSDVEALAAKHDAVNPHRVFRGVILLLLGWLTV
jgi:hypothetical protein